MSADECLSAELIEKRRAEYRATYEAQRRTVNDPAKMAMLREKIAELHERKRAAIVVTGAGRASS